MNGITNIGEILNDLEIDRDAWQARAEAAENELSAVRFAAQMPDDYEYGLSSWIHQYLYAAYIGAEIPRSVLERVATGALVFPEAPIYAEYKRLQGRVQELEAQLAQEWRPVDRPPAVFGQYIVFGQYFDEEVFTAAVYWDNGEWLNIHTELPIDYKVYHWHPLPLPPSTTPPQPAATE